MRYLFTPLLLLIVLVTLPVVAQYQPPVQATIKKMVADLRAGKPEDTSLGILYQPINVAAVLHALTPLYLDSLPAVRVKSYHLTATIGSETAQPALRKSAVHVLLQGCRDHESGISGTCSKALQQFQLADFDAAARREVAALLSPKALYLSQVAQLAGFLGESEYESLLLNLLLETKLSRKDKWSLQLALARMGNPEMLSQVVSRVKSVPVNDDLVYEAAPALVYVRQPQSLAYLFEIMMRDDRNCASANPDSDEKILCAYRVLEYIAPVVKDFPLKLDESGDVNVKDYETALQNARAWYSEHKNDYTLIKNNF